MGKLLERGEDVAGLAVVEDDAAAARLGSDEAECRPEGCECEVRNDAKAGEEGWAGRVQAGDGELVG